mgnify:CR=1 FL=1
MVSSPTVSTAWLADNLDNVKILDGSFYLPAENRDAEAEYTAAHLPGAQRFNINAVCAPSDLPHMFPDPVDFADAVGAMGIGNDDMVVTYDGGKLTGACRVWWMFRAFGHDKVAVLDGGFKKWRAEDRAIESVVAAPAAASFCADYREDMVRSVDHVLALIDQGGETQIVDARSAGRFHGTAAEPRAGLRSGHMPGAHNLPYDQLLNEDGTLRAPNQLRDLFDGAGVNLARPVLTSCGSGVSAAVLLLGLAALGHTANTLYDGSWSEWGSRDDTPIVT